MKVCLIGVFSDSLNEGYKNIAYNLSRELSKRHDVMEIDVNDLFSIRLWRRVRQFEPDVVHYLTAPTLFSFVALRAFRVFGLHSTKLVMSSLHPYSLRILGKLFLNKVISFIRPDLIFVQCRDAMRLIKKLGCKVSFLANGVEIERFLPVSDEVKYILREKYKVDENKFIVLHVGHIRENRGLRVLGDLQRNYDDIQVIIVGSSYFEVDEGLYHDLKLDGCLLWNRYFDSIEEIYALADCYIFPTPRGESIFMPLSVLEAMSCNLPVISTRYEGLVDNFKEGNGLMFFDNEIEIYKGLELIKNGDVRIATREKVVDYSWDNVTKKLESVYELILRE